MHNRSTASMATIRLPSLTATGARTQMQVLPLRCHIIHVLISRRSAIAPYSQLPTHALADSLHYAPRGLHPRRFLVPCSPSCGPAAHRGKLASGASRVLQLTRELRVPAAGSTEHAYPGRSSIARCKDALHARRRPAPSHIAGHLASRASTARSPVTTLAAVETGPF